MDEKNMRDCNFSERNLAVSFLKSSVADADDGEERIQSIREAIKRGDHAILEVLAQVTELSLKDLFKSFWLFRSTASGLHLCEKVLSVNPSLTTWCDDNMQVLLHHAAKQCDIDVCHLLISKGAEVDARDICENTPLLFAVVENMNDVNQLDRLLELISFMISAGADVNAADVMGSTSFMEAVLSRHLVLARCLVKFGANVWHTNHCLTTALMLACYTKDIECIKYILQSEGLDPEYINKTNENGVTALHIAVSSGAKTVTEILLENGAETKINGYLEWFEVPAAVFPLEYPEGVGYEPSSGYSVMMYAYKAHSLDVMECLLHFGCDINALDENGVSLLHVCIVEGNMKFLKALVALGADINLLTSPDSQLIPDKTPLSLAATEGNTEIVHFLLNNGCDVNMLNKAGRTALFSACDSPEIVNLLIKHGADVNVVDMNGITSLIYAVSCNCYQSTKLLLFHGAHLNQTPSGMHQSSLLHVVVARPSTNLSMLKLLLDHDANINACNQQGQTPLMCHVRQSVACHETVSILLQYGADVNITDVRGRNVCFISVCTNEAQAIAELLSTAGAKVDCLDNAGCTPLTYAISHHSVHDVYALLKVNCNVNMKKPLQLAVLTEEYTMSVMLYLAGCDVNQVNVWTETENDRQYRVPVKNRNLLDWLRDVTTHTQTLKLLCRKVVRTSIGSKGFKVRMLQLPVPQVIKQYLNLDDLKCLLK